VFGQPFFVRPVKSPGKIRIEKIFWPGGLPFYLAFGVVVYDLDRCNEFIVGLRKVPGVVIPGKFNEKSRNKIFRRLLLLKEQYLISFGISNFNLSP